MVILIDAVGVVVGGLVTAFITIDRLVPPLIMVLISTVSLNALLTWQTDAYPVRLQLVPL